MTQAKLISATLGMLVLFGLFTSANAGWHHHRGYYVYGTAPAVYAAPSYAAPQYSQASPPVVVMQQESPGSSLMPLIIEALLRRLPEDTNRARNDRDTIRSESNGDTSAAINSLKQELQSLRTETTGGFENVSSVLRRHGEEIVQLRLDLKEINGITKTLKTIEENLTTTGESSIQERLDEIKSHLSKVNADEVIEAATSDLALKGINGVNKLTDADKEKLRKTLKEAITNVIKNKLKENN